MLGLLGAIRRGTSLDTASTTLATLLTVVPVFLFADLFAEYFVSAGTSFRSAGRTPGRRRWRRSCSRSRRRGSSRDSGAGAVETMEQDYVRTARSKGLARERILLAHVLRNSLTPFLAAAAPTLALLITGSFFVEAAFGIPGAADQFVNSARLRDSPMVMGLTVALAVVLLIVNLVADLLTAALDPRILETRP